MEYDPDDELLPPTLTDIYWHYANRFSEWGLWYIRQLGWKEEAMFYCENPTCLMRAGMRKKFLDPRRGPGDDMKYSERYFCSPECEQAIVDELERQAQYARCVS